MVTPSLEIKAMILQWFERIASGDMVAAAQQVLSSDSTFVAIGTSSHEWIVGREALISAYADAAKLGPPRLQVIHLEAFSEGPVAWAFDSLLLRRPGGVDLPIRHTFVLHKEGDAWKVVHAHYSFGVEEEAVPPAAH